MCISEASRSVSFPLPSSPHWVPTTTVAGTRSPRSLVAADYAPLYPGRNGGPKWGSFTALAAMGTRRGEPATAPKKGAKGGGQRADRSPRRVRGGQRRDRGSRAG